MGESGPDSRSEELLDVVDADGNVLYPKPRSAVHRDGDWHRAIHVWFTGATGVILQRRARTKAAWPGMLDASAAGHLSAGESILDGLREVQEELGITLDPAQLVDLGVHTVDEPTATGRNRERQHVFAVRDDRPLTAYTAFDRFELDGLVAVTPQDFAQLVAGRVVSARTWDGEQVRASPELAPTALVPAVYLATIAQKLIDLAT